jgi:hypothetical protein
MAPGGRLDSHRLAHHLLVGVNTVLASRWTVRILRLGTLVALVGVRRWRHLFVFLGSVIAVELVAYQLSLLLARPRPVGIKIIGSWAGFSMPSYPVAALAVTLVGMAYALLPAGRGRGGGGRRAQRCCCLGCHRHPGEQECRQNRNHITQKVMLVMRRCYGRRPEPARIHASAKAPFRRRGPGGFTGRIADGDPLPDFTIIRILPIRMRRMPGSAWRESG